MKVIDKSARFWILQNKEAAERFVQNDIRARAALPEIIDNASIYYKRLFASMEEANRKTTRASFSACWWLASASTSAWSTSSAVPS